MQHVAGGNLPTGAGNSEHHRFDLRILADVIESCFRLRDGVPLPREDAPAFLPRDDALDIDDGDFLLAEETGPLHKHLLLEHRSFEQVPDRNHDATGQHYEQSEKKQGACQHSHDFPTASFCHFRPLLEAARADQNRVLQRPPDR